MSWLSRAVGINIPLSKLVPGASTSTIRRGLESLRLDAATLRIVATVARELAMEKEEKS